MLWHSFGSIAALLQEVISVYPAINPPTLTVTHTYNNNNKKTLQVFLY
jgi:CCR4-NOT transcription complex subunit 9